MARTVAVVALSVVVEAAAAWEHLAPLDLRAVASSAVAQLHTFYDWETGFWGNFSGGVPFWTTANAVEMLSNYMIETLDTSPLPRIENTFVKMALRYCEAGPEGSCYMDDHLWWVHAWARAYTATGNATYLSQAQAIYSDILVRWDAWNRTCGGLTWELGHAYVNSIPNELFLSASTRLAALTHSATPVGNYTYQEWAGVEYGWLMSTPLPVPQPGGGVLFTDGLSTANCSEVNAGGAYWTYNNGVAVSGLSALTAATDDGVYAATGRAVLDTAMAYFAANEGGVLYERSCGADGACSGQDGRQFKGALVRHVGYALEGLVTSSPTPGATRARYTSFLLNQTASILAHASLDVPGGVQFGQLWQGPYGEDDTPWVSQVAGLDAVLAALAALGGAPAVNVG